LVLAALLFEVVVWTLATDGNFDPPHPATTTTAEVRSASAPNRLPVFFDLRLIGSLRRSIHS